MIHSLLPGGFIAEIDGTLRLMNLPPGADASAARSRKYLAMALLKSSAMARR